MFPASLSGSTRRVFEIAVTKPEYLSLYLLYDVYRRNSVTTRHITFRIIATVRKGKSVDQ